MSVTRMIPITNMRGLHARASRKLAELALSYESTRVSVRHDGEEADARSLMDLMMLGAGIGDEVEIEVRGPQADEAMSAVEALFASKFNEEA